MREAVDSKWMKFAIAEALKGRNTAFPNPMVGAVLVSSDQRVLAQGFHEKPGHWHAERNALEGVSNVPKGATLYVTLEPCCSWGRTPPCIDIIQEKGVERVVVGMLDPDIRMGGTGIAKLKKRGVVVEVGVEEEACREINHRYLRIRTQKRPTVAIKIGTSIDARVTDAHHKSKWITSPLSRESTHNLRSVYDGILVGSGTLLADDPSLNCRIEGGRNPIPIIMDTHACCPADAKVLVAGKRPILCVGPDAPKREDLEVDYLVGQYDGSMIDIPDLLQKLYKRGIYTVLVEGGAQVIRSFIEADCVDILEVYMGNVFLGGGKMWGEGCDFRLEHAPRLTLRSMEALNSDVHLSYFWER